MIWAVRKFPPVVMTIYIYIILHACCHPCMRKKKWFYKGLEFNILNGKPAEISAFPYSARIIGNCDEGSYICTGSLIHPYVVLTAGHCVVCEPGHPSSDLTVSVGSGDINDGLTITVRYFVLHEGYHEFEDHIVNDIALIVLGVRLKQSSTIGFIKLPHDAHPSFGHVKTAGWGLTTKGVNADMDVHINYCIEKVVPYEICKNRIRITRHNFCTFLSENNCESLSGDSGGAVTTLDGQYQIGIVSYGDDVETMTVIVNVSDYLPWLRHKMADITKHVRYKKIPTWKWINTMFLDSEQQTGPGLQVDMYMDWSE